MSRFNPNVQPLGERSKTVRLSDLYNANGEPTDVITKFKEKLAGSSDWLSDWGTIKKLAPEDAGILALPYAAHAENLDPFEMDPKPQVGCLGSA